VLQHAIIAHSFASNLISSSDHHIYFILYYFIRKGSHIGIMSECLPHTNIESAIGFSRNKC